MAIGIGLLSNVLKVVLARLERPAHAALLGLLVGSVAGLWPFQEAVHPDLVSKRDVKAVVMLLEGAEADVLEEETGVSWDEAERAALKERYAGMSKGDLKLLGLQLDAYPPTGGRIGAALGILACGFLLTRALGKK